MKILSDADEKQQNSINSGGGMNKITKKLFRYFAALLLIFAVTAFAGFSLVLSFYTQRSYERELRRRAEAIAGQIEDFIGAKGPGKGRGAYLRFLDDIAMADAYVVDAEGGAFSFSRSASTREPTGEARRFAACVFASAAYESSRERDGQGRDVFFCGAPVMLDGKTVAAVVITDSPDTGRDGLLPAVYVLACCLLGATLLSGVLSVFLSRHFVLPIQQIARTTRELAGGNYLAATDVHDKTELGELAGEIDCLAQKLESARLEGIRLEQMQKDYISNISHELRTPVTVIRSSLEAVCDGVVTGEKAMEYQRQVLAESISLQRLINDMLELSRLQNKDFPIEKADMDLFMALEDALRAVRVLAAEKSIRITLERPEGDWRLYGDYGRLRQMFVAALDNAIKYSEEGEPVLVCAKRYPNAVEISIRDRGCGIPPENLEHIFARFYRSRPGRVDGSGLGLAIMKSIGERHGIDIRLQSEPGRGTEVIFLVPSANIPESDMEMTSK